MLIEFKVTNFRSIKETQTLSMVAGKGLKDKALEGNTFESGIANFPKLLRSSVIYGPNASGKSNLMAAITFMENMVRESAREAQVGEPIEIIPFRLDAATREQDTEFEIHFIAENVRYQYGFTLNTQRITSEWLYAYPHGSPQRWFERQYDAVKGKYEYEFKPSFAEGKARQERADQTIANNLYLSVAVQKNSQQLLPVFTWFQKKLNYILSMNHLSRGLTSKLCQEVKGKDRVLAFMNAAGIRVTDFSVEKKLFTLDDLPEDFPDEFKQKVLKDMEGTVSYKTKFLYQASDGEFVAFDLEEESDGTQALFSFAARWLDLLETDAVLFVDEIDTSLHPLLVHHLIKLLHSSKSRAQLIFTTHDTTLLSQSIMRRDQVWFVEKDQQQSTQLYSLADFSPRNNEALEKGYLSGRYGAIPFLSELDFYGE
ncbi:MAG: ATP-binding protein [Methylotenera sp.]